MRRAAIFSLVAAGALLAAGVAMVVLRPAPTHARSIPKPESAAVSLEFSELLDSGPTLRPSTKALSLHGKRVRMVGFMAEMEEPIAGAFYLVPRPMRLDESGGGTGDLPLESVLVVVPGTEGKALPHVEGPLEGIGVLDVGNRADGQGRVANFRLSLDSSPPVGGPAKHAARTPSQASSPTYAAVAAFRN